jgi:hypothetical protein
MYTPTAQWEKAHMLSHPSILLVFFFSSLEEEKFPAHYYQLEWLKKLFCTT